MVQNQFLRKLITFMLKLIQYVGIGCFLILFLLYLPVWRFFPIQKIDELPNDNDVLVFTSNLFINRIILDGPNLFAVNLKTGFIYNWYGLLHARDSSWTNNHDNMLISTGATYAGEPLNSFLLTSKGSIQHIDFYGKLSPDGNKIAYTEKFSLFVYNLTTKKTSEVNPSNVWVDDFSWSPDATYIAFISPDEVYKKGTNIYQESKSFKVMRVTLNNLSLLPLTDTINGTLAGDLQWSGDGTMLSFNYASSTKWVTSILFTNGQGLYEIPEFGNHCQPLLHFYEWLHQDSKLSLFCENNPTQLWILDTKTNSAKLIKEFEQFSLYKDVEAIEMAWSPNNTKLAFTLPDKNGVCALAYEGSFCSEGIYIYDMEKDILNRVPLSHWLEDIRDIEWVRISE